MTAKPLGDVPRPKLTLQDAAEYLQVSERSLAKLVKTNEIPHFRVGRLIRFDVDAIDEWAVSQSSASRSEAAQ